MILLFITDESFAIGYQGDLVYHISQDQKRFKEITTGNIVVMGRKTLESLPGGRPLKNRDNVVLTRQNLPPQPGLYVVHDKAALLQTLHALNPDGQKKVFHIGGGHAVEALWDLVDAADITMIHKRFDQVDTWIPNLQTDPEWTLVQESAPESDGAVTYTYQQYRRNRA